MCLVCYLDDTIIYFIDGLLHAAADVIYLYIPSCLQVYKFVIIIPFYWFLTKIELVVIFTSSFVQCIIEIFIPSLFFYNFKCREMIDKLYIRDKMDQAFLLSIIFVYYQVCFIPRRICDLLLHFFFVL